MQEKQQPINMWTGLKKWQSRWNCNYWNIWDETDKRKTHAVWRHPGRLVNNIITILLSETQRHLSICKAHSVCSWRKFSQAGGWSGGKQNKIINQDWMDGELGWRRSRRRRKGGRLHEARDRETGCGCLRRQQVCDWQKDDQRVDFGIQMII